MAEFKFRLEKVERVRQLIEEQKKQEWIIREQELRRHKARLQSLLRRKDEVMEFGYGQNSLVIRTAMYDYLAVLGEEISVQESKILQCEQQTAAAKEEWFFALQEKEKVETLRTNSFKSIVKNSSGRSRSS